MRGRSADERRSANLLVRVGGVCEGSGEEAVGLIFRVAAGVGVDEVNVG